MTKPLTKPPTIACPNCNASLSLSRDQYGPSASCRCGRRWYGAQADALLPPPPAAARPPTTGAPETSHRIGMCANPKCDKPVGEVGKYCDLTHKCSRAVARSNYKRNHPDRVRQQGEDRRRRLAASPTEPPTHPALRVHLGSTEFSVLAALIDLDRWATSAEIARRLGRTEPWPQLLSLPHKHLTESRPMSGCTRKKWRITSLGRRVYAKMLENEARSFPAGGSIVVRL